MTSGRLVLRCPQPHRYTTACPELIEVGAAGLDAAREALCLHLQDRHNWEHGTAFLLAARVEPVEVVVLVGESLPLLDGPQPAAGWGSSRQPSGWRGDQ